MTTGAAATAPGDAPPLAGLLDAVLAGTGRSLVSARLRSLDPVSGGELQGYDVVARDSAGAEESHLLYVEPAGQGGSAPGVLRVEGEGAAYEVWAYPRDPALPALPAAAHPEGARVLLGRLGVELGSLPETVTARIAATIRTRTDQDCLRGGPPVIAASMTGRSREKALDESSLTFPGGGTPPHLLGYYATGTPISRVDLSSGSRREAAAQVPSDPHPPEFPR